MNVDAQRLQELVRVVLEGAGTAPKAARVVADHLVLSSSSGHESHGVSRLPQYVTHLEQGNVDGTAEPEVISETASTLVLDGARAFGQYSANIALEKAIAKAEQVGSCTAVIRHATHLGRLGDFTETAAASGMVSFVTTGASGLDLGWMLLPGTDRRFIGANPWSFGFPTSADPVIFDASMTNVAQGKVHVAKSEGKALPPDWVVHPDGSPSDDPDTLYNGGGLVPLGGAVAGHKGFSLGLIAALLGGLCMIDDDAPTPVATNLQLGGTWTDPRVEANPWLAGAFVHVVDPAAFGGRDTYASMIQTLRASAHGAHPGGDDAVLFPGEFEAAQRARTAREGIRLPDAIADELRDLSTRFGAPMPEPLDVG